MRTFSSVGEFVRYLSTRPLAVKEAEKTGLKSVARMLETNAQAMIGEEVREWADLASSTVEEKQRLGYVGRVSATDPLLRTGQLRSSISAEVDGHKVVLGSTDPVAVYQELGTARIPPRPFIGSTLFRDGGDAAEIVANHVAGALAGMPGPLKHITRRDGDGSSE